MSAQRFCQELRLLDPATLCDFYTYASHRQCLDSLHFILSVEQYSELPPWQRLEAEQQIFSRYLDTLGPSRVNVTEQIIQTVAEDYGHGKPAVFEPALIHCAHLLAWNAWSDFKSIVEEKSLQLTDRRSVTAIKDKEIRKYLMKRLPSEIVSAAYFVLTGNRFSKTIVPPLSHERILHEWLRTSSVELRARLLYRVARQARDSTTISAMFRLLQNDSSFLLRFFEESYRNDLLSSMSGSGCLLGDDAFSFTLFEDLCLVVGRDWICSTLTVYVTNTYSMKLDLEDDGSVLDFLDMTAAFVDHLTHSMLPPALRLVLLSLPQVAIHYVSPNSLKKVPVKDIALQWLVALLVRAIQNPHRWLDRRLQGPFSLTYGRSTVAMLEHCFQCLISHSDAFTVTSTSSSSSLLDRYRELVRPRLARWIALQSSNIEHRTMAASVPLDPNDVTYIGHALLLSWPSIHVLFSTASLGSLDVVLYRQAGTHLPARSSKVNSLAMPSKKHQKHLRLNLSTPISDDDIALIDPRPRSALSRRSSSSDPSLPPMPNSPSANVTPRISSLSERSPIVIVGGGLAGLTLLRELSKLKQYRVVIVEPSDTFILPSARFHARFLLPPEQRKDYLAKYSSSMSNFLTRTNQEHLQECVQRVCDNRVITETSEIPFSALIICSGVEHGMPSRRSAFKETKSLTVLSSSESCVGLTMAAAIASTYPSIKVNLVHSGRHPIDGCKSKAVRAITNTLEKLNITCYSDPNAHEWRSKDPSATSTQASIILSNGSILRSDLVLRCPHQPRTGFMEEFLNQFLDPISSRILINENFNICKVDGPFKDNVFACGDVAVFYNQPSENLEMLPAMTQAHALAQNVKAYLKASSKQKPYRSQPVQRRRFLQLGPSDAFVLENYSLLAKGKEALKLVAHHQQYIMNAVAGGHASRQDKA